MTEARIQQLREWIAGNGTPREFVPLNAAECRELLDLAEGEARRRTFVGSGRRKPQSLRR